MKGEPPLVLLKGISKRFPNVQALSKVDFDLHAGEVHAVVGENGAGKTTLMNILSGYYEPDEGEIYVEGQRVYFRSPMDAILRGIGMVHQHFTLVQPFTVAENVALGMHERKGVRVDIEFVKRRILEASKEYGLKVDPDAYIWQLSAGEQQRVEILRTLIYGVKVLILDEPTSVLTPQETKELFKAIRDFRDRGIGVIFISHKIPEVMEVSDRITVLRGGKRVATMKREEVTDPSLLARLIVGSDRLLAEKPAIGEARPEIEKKEVLRVEGIEALKDNKLPALRDVSLTIYSGEILGIAGVAGNGQKELVEVITGLRKVEKGKIILNGRDVTNWDARRLMRFGVVHIPEDRVGVGIIGEMPLYENSMLTNYFNPGFSRRGLLSLKEIKDFTLRLIRGFRIKAPGPEVEAKTLSGGNIQKFIVARELSKKPQLVIASQPTKGLDVASTKAVRNALKEFRKAGCAILLVGEDLDEILEMSDRIAVIYEGRIMGVMKREEARVEDIGRMMTGVTAS